MNLDNFERNIYKLKKVLFKSKKDIDNFIKAHSGVSVIDQYDFLLEELFFLRNPRFRFEKFSKEDWKLFLEKYTKSRELFLCGNWFYFPWKKQLIHFLPHEEHQEMRTGRNKNLVNKEEQNIFYNSHVGVMGMSVGSHVALTLAMTGGARKISIADLDIVSGSNLNRIRSGFSEIGVAKTIAVARQIYEINPYAQVKIFKKGINDKNLNNFLTGRGKMDVLVEETDFPYLKIRVREVCGPMGIPVIMAADNGDGVIVDVERYDLNRKYPLLHGIIKGVKAVDFKKVHPKDLPAVIARIAGAKYAPKRMLESVSEVGKTLYSWPQLGTAATMCGSTLTNLARRIILKEDVKSGRYVVDEIKMFKKVL